MATLLICYYYSIFAALPCLEQEQAAFNFYLVISSCFNNVLH